MKVVHTSKENPLSYLISLSAVSLFQSFLLRHHAKPKTTPYENPALSHGVYFLFQLYRLPVEILSQSSAILQHSNKDLAAFIMQIL